MISVVFFTNYLFHHQYPFCREMFRQDDVHFNFVCCEPLTQERIAMGYKDMSHLPFVIRSYEDNESYKRAAELAVRADVAIFGSADLNFYYSRLRHNKLTFRYCERSLRKGTWRIIIPTTAAAIYNQYIRFRNKNLYILSASAYTSHDLSLFGFNIAKCFKWGYLPDVYKSDDPEQLIGKKTPKSILWVGRFIDCKHPEFALQAAKKLTDKGIDYSLKFIGDGPLREGCENYVRQKIPDADISFMGSLSPEDVRAHMDDSSIFIFNSDRYEGWGAVLGESMNSGCAVLASHSCGSAPYLIDQDVNGRVYRYNDMTEFCEALEEYLSDPELTHRLGLNAYYTMADLWNIEVAVPRLLNIVKALSKGLSVPEYKSGPCSKADYIINNWYHRLK